MMQQDTLTMEIQIALTISSKEKKLIRHIILAPLVGTLLEVKL